MEENPFIDNIYTLWYYSIIDNALQRDNQNQYTERHHIIPECFYQKRRRKGAPGWLSGNPDTKSNIVKLTAREHFVCHWLLTKMVINELAKHQMLLALSTFQWSSRTQKRLLTSRQYERARLAVKQARDQQTWYTNDIEERWCLVCPAGWRKGRIKGNKWWNNGVVETKAKTCPNGFTLGRLPGAAGGKGTKWFNNGFEQVMSYTCPPGFSPGPLLGYFGNKNKILCNNGIEQKFVTECPPGWSLGPLQSNIVKGKHWWTNGTAQCYSFECPPGWKKGMLKGKAPTTAGLKWYNNGMINKLLKECPDGWHSGQIKDKSSSHFKWYTNGIKSIKTDKCPQGWIPGRVIKK